MMRKGFAAAVAAWLSLTASAAQATQAAQAAAPAKPCLNRDEAEAFLTVLIPPLVRTAARTCAPVLGPNAYLLTHGEALAVRYDAASAAAWPVAMKAATKVVGTQLPDPEMVKALVQTVIGPAIAGKIKPDMCSEIDQVMADLDPLPPRNFTELAVLVLQGLLKKQAHLDVQLCPATAG